MLTAIRQWVIKTMMKGNTGVVQTMPKQQIIEMNVQITAQRMMQNGINPNDLKTVGQVENVVNQIDAPKVNVNPGVTGVKKAEVFDIDGNKIPEGSGIIGGKEMKSIKQGDPITSENFGSSQFAPDNQYGFGRKRESDAAIKARLDKRNEEGLASFKNKSIIPKDEYVENSRNFDQEILGKKNKPLDVDDVLPDSVYNETPGEFTRRNTPGSKENLLQELKIAYEKDFNKLRGDETVEELQKILKDLDTDGVPFADGGRIGLLAGSVPKISGVISRLLKNKKKVDQAVNDIFPTGDYKYDAQMAADAIVENNPKTFKGMLYEDLDMDTQMEVYGAALSGVNKQNALMLQMKKATRPEKTLQSMKEGKGINMSDPEIADEFARFMKQTDPKGTKDIEEKILLESFDPKRTKGNADGGRIGLKGGTFLKGLSYLKELLKPKPKKLENTVNEFIEKRKFLKSMVGETEKNKKARELKMLKDAMEEARENPGFKFKNVDVDKDIRPTFDKEIAESLKKNRKLNADGGRIGLKGGMTKRAFMKLMGGVGASIGAAKSGIFSGFGKGAGKTVAKEVAQQTTSSMPPPYFFKLAEKIKNMGTDVTATTDRTISKSLLSKDGKSEYILEESLTSGDTLIKKVYKEEDMITNVEIMSLKKGEDVVTKKGKAIKTADEYEEVTETNSRVYKDNFNDPDYEDGINVDEIIKEVDDQAPPIKYASGGLAYMLGE